MGTPHKKQNTTFKEKIATQKWLTLIAMPVLLITTFNNIYSIWGVLFIYWGATSVYSGEVFLVENIERDKSPILFWTISAMWIGFGIMYILTDLYHNYWLAG